MTLDQLNEARSNYRTKRGGTSRGPAKAKTWIVQEQDDTYGSFVDMHTLTGTLRTAERWLKGNRNSGCTYRILEMRGVYETCTETVVRKVRG